MTDTPMWVIRSTDVDSGTVDDNGIELDDYWSNTYGWTEHAEHATRFTDDEVRAFNLPMEGEWVLVGGPHFPDTNDHHDSPRGGA